MASPGFTAGLVARAVALRSTDVPEAAIRVAKATLLDTLAVALAARSERVVRVVHAFLATEGCAGHATVWGSSALSSAPRAALANGTAAHALDFDDVCWAMNSHPSAVLWPTALAVADSVGASGTTALLGYVAGFEAAADLGTVLGREHYAAGWHPTATIGTVGAAVTAGKILGLDEPTLRRAVGIACSEAAGSRMNFGTDTKPLHAGLAAGAGVTAALLATHGLTAREDGIEASMGLAALYAGALPGQARRGFALIEPGVELKPYPSCRFTHRIVDGVLALRARHGARAIDSLECTVDPFAERIVIYPDPGTGLEAKFSMQHSAAVAWLDGHPGLAAFGDARVLQDDVQALRARVTVRAGTADAETVRVRFADGGADEERVQTAKGSPGRPMSTGERLAKVRDCAAPWLGDRVEELARWVEALETAASVRELGGRIAGPAPASPATGPAGPAYG